jgi:hypothetical protein
MRRLCHDIGQQPTTQQHRRRGKKHREKKIGKTKKHTIRSKT